jgi:hypothetical protein
MLAVVKDQEHPSAPQGVGEPVEKIFSRPLARPEGGGNRLDNERRISQCGQFDDLAAVTEKVSSVFAEPQRQARLSDTAAARQGYQLRAFAQLVAELPQVGLAPDEARPQRRQSTRLGLAQSVPSLHPGR